MGNILAIVANLDEGQRVSFLASFMRFILELAQQVCEGIVVGRADVDPNNFDDFDNNMLLQEGRAMAYRVNKHDEGDGSSLMQTQKTPNAVLRRLAQDLQHALELSGPHQVPRARELRRSLATRYFGLKDDALHSEVHELEAMLIAYDDVDNLGSCNAIATVEPANAWVETWWKRLVEHLARMDRDKGLHVNEIDRCVQQTGSAEPVDLDTPTWPEPEGPDERDLHDLRLQEENRTAEEERILQMVAAYEEEQKAAAAQREDDRILQSAVDAPRTKQPRLQMDIQVTSGSSSSASTRINVPLSENNSTAVISIQPKKVNATMANETIIDTDVNNLMQRRTTSPSTSAPGHIDEDTLHNIRVLLNMMNDHSRGHLLYTKSAGKFKDG